MLFFSFKKKYQSQIGLEFVDNKLQTIALEKNNHGIQIQSSCIIKIKDNNEIAINAALEQARETLPKHMTKTVFGINFENCMMKDIPIDRSLNDNEIITYIENCSREFFGHDNKQLFLDYEKTNDTMLRIIAVRKKIFTSLLDAICQNGFQVIAMDINALALCRAFALLNNAEDSSEQIAIVLIRRFNMLVCVVQNQHLIYAKSENYHKHVNEDISFPSIVSTLQHMLQYYHSLHPESPVNKILLNGDNEMVNAILSIINQDTQLSVFNTKGNEFISTSLLSTYGLAAWRMQ